MQKLAPLTLALLVVAAALAGPAGAQAGNATLAFRLQSSGGHVVTAAFVDLPAPGFLVLHDAKLLSGDAFGSVIGVTELLPAGNHTDVRVRLTRALAGANETLVAMPHRDTNGNGVYDFVATRGAQDGPFTGGPQANANGVVVAPANVNVTAAVWARTPQVSSGTSVLVDLVDMAQGGFLAVHDATLVSAQDAFGSVVGVSPYLPPGVHRDVLVPFTFNASKPTVSGTVYLMPHRDTDGDQAYDFVATRGAADAPYPGDAPTFAGSLALQAVDLQVSREAGVNFTATSTGGHLVVVPQVFLPDPGFVAIHDGTLVSAGDAFTSVIGVSARLPAGLHHNVSVPLGPVPGNNKPFTSNASDTLVAMPHKDTNNNSVYEFITSRGAQDGPFTGGANGTGANGIVLASATVTRAAAVVFEDQASANGRAVVVAAVDLSEAGFVALHDMTLVTQGDALGSVVGVSTKLPAGLHRNVTITVGQNVPGSDRTGALNGSQTLVAMPHRDTNNNSAYDFVSSRGAQDGPFTAGGAAVVDRARVATAFVVPPATTTPPPTATPPGTTPATPTPPATGTPAATPPVTGTPVGTSPATTSPAATSPAATSPAATSPAATSPAATSPAISTPATTPEDTDDAPGFELVALVAALGAALLVLRRRA